MPLILIDSNGPSRGPFSPHALPSPARSRLITRITSLECPLLMRFRGIGPSGPLSSAKRCPKRPDTTSNRPSALTKHSSRREGTHSRAVTLSIHAPVTSRKTSRSTTKTLMKSRMASHAMMLRVVWWPRRNECLVTLRRKPSSSCSGRKVSKVYLSFIFYFDCRNEAS